jgi:histidyl-tRNA synthetase
VGDGALDIVSEAEIPAIIYRAFTALGLEHFCIRVNNRKILTGFYALLGLSERAGDIMRTVDKLDKIGGEKVAALLIEEGIPRERTREILEFTGRSGDTAAVLSLLRLYAGRNELFDAGLAELETVTRYLAAFGVPETHFAIDLTIARGLDYYTGTVYETILTQHPEIGSVCSGGRYDNLAEYYTNKPLPGVGISIGLTRLFYVLGEQGYLNDEMLLSPAEVLILPMTEDITEAVAFATRLRAVGLRTQLYTEGKKFKQRVGYADKMGIPFVAFVGEEEIAAHTISLKHLPTGQQLSLSQELAVAEIIKVTAALRHGAPIRETPVTTNLGE